MSGLPDPTEHPDGLTFAFVLDGLLLDEAKREVGSRFRIASTFEAGINYKVAETKHRCTVSLPIKRIPAVHALIQAAMKVLERPIPDSHEESLNIICRQYGPGDRLGFHRDSVGLFGEEVFGAVLLCDASPGLVFRCGSGVNRRDFVVPESPGLVFVSAGPSRYIWCHGVPPRLEGSTTRISVTWRWLRSSVRSWFALDARPRDAWAAGFVESARAAGIPDEQTAAFLYQGSPWYVTKNDRMGPLLTAEAMTSAFGIQSLSHLPNTEDSLLARVNMESRLLLLQRWEEVGQSMKEYFASECKQCRQNVPRPASLKDSDCEWEAPDLFAESGESDGSITLESPAKVVFNRFAALDDSDSSSLSG